MHVYAAMATLGSKTIRPAKFHAIFNYSYVIRLLTLPLIIIIMHGIVHL